MPISVSTRYDKKWPSYDNFKMWLSCLPCYATDDITSNLHITCAATHHRPCTCIMCFMLHQPFVVKSSGQTSWQTINTPKHIQWKHYHLGIAGDEYMTSGFALLLCSSLTHWGRVTHICVGILTSIGSDNGLSPGRRQANIWTSAGILLIEPLGTNFSEILIRIQAFSFKKMHLKMSSAKWRPFCLVLNVLTVTMVQQNSHHLFDV